MNRKERRRQNKAQQKATGQSRPQEFSPPSAGGVSSTLMNYAQGGKVSGQGIETASVPSLTDDLPRAASLMQGGQPGEAASICERLFPFYPADPDLHHLAGLIAIQNGQVSKAKGYLLTAVDLAPDYVEAQANLATLLHRTGDHAGAETAYRRAIELKADLPEALYNLGSLLLNSGRIEEAVQLFEKSVAVDPTQSDSYVSLSYATLALGDTPTAREHVDHALAIDPENVSALVQKADILLGSEDFAGAEILLIKAIDRSPEIAEFHQRLGYVRHCLGDVDGAVSTWRKAVALAPDSADALVGLGQALEVAGEDIEAEALFRKALQLAPNSQDALAKLGLFLAENNRYEEAEKPLQQAIELNPNNAQLKFSLGATKRSAGDYEAAVPLYQDALALDSSYAAGFWEFGHALESIGRKEEAVEAYENCLARDPENSVARHLLSALKGETTETAPASYVEELFDDYAATFDQSLVGDLGYQSPERIRELIKEIPETSFQRVLDLGCGTGLIAAAISDLAVELVGVDLSQKMLDEAERKGLYAETHHSDIVTFLTDPNYRDDLYDLAIASDVLTYIGNLAPVLTGVESRLTGGGQFIFTAELFDDDTEDAGFILRPSGRFAHSIDYLRRAINTAGFLIEILRPTIIRMDEDRPIDGTLVLAKRR